MSFDMKYQVDYMKNNLTYRPMEPFKNLYHLRKVAETGSKPCTFCYKPTSSVLITSDGSSDFFYTCDAHLKDTTFATPIYDQEYLDAKAQKESLDKEIAALKLRWDEKNRYAGWDSLMKKFSSKEKEKDDKDKKDEEKSKDPEQQLKDLTSKASSHATILQKQPRTYQLNKDIYKMRIDKKFKTKITAQQASLNQKLKDPTFFPSAPKGAP